MRCNPQHYYLLHEMGHMLGMPHATIYKLTEQSVNATVSLWQQLSWCCMSHAFE
jgi:hypothetical protein